MAVLEALKNTFKYFCYFQIMLSIGDAVVFLYSTDDKCSNIDLLVYIYGPFSFLTMCLATARVNENQDSIPRKVVALMFSLWALITVGIFTMLSTGNLSLICEDVNLNSLTYNWIQVSIRVRTLSFVALAFLTIPLCCFLAPTQEGARITRRLSQASLGMETQTG